MQGVGKADTRDPVIFNDQMGAGRTTTGMVIACMIRSLQQPGELAQASEPARQLIAQHPGFCSSLERRAG